jgi:hypothetical protein
MSCASLSKDQCYAANWSNIGFQDGSRGYLSNRVNQHIDACKEYDIAININEYMQGHKQGVRQYCNNNQGFNLGRRGSRYNGVCPSDLAKNFLAGYNEGKRVHQLENTVREIAKEIKAIEQEKDELDSEIADNEATIISNNTSSVLRRELLKQNRKLEQLVKQKDREIKRVTRRMNSTRQTIRRMLAKRGIQYNY